MRCEGKEERGQLAEMERIGSCPNDRRAVCLYIYMHPSHPETSRSQSLGVRDGCRRREGYSAELKVTLLLPSSGSSAALLAQALWLLDVQAEGEPQSLFVAVAYTIAGSALWAACLDLLVQPTSLSSSSPPSLPILPALHLLTRRTLSIKQPRERAVLTIHPEVHHLPVVVHHVVLVVVEALERLLNLLLLLLGRRLLILNIRVVVIRVLAL